MENTNKTGEQNSTDGVGVTETQQNKTCYECGEKFQNQVDDECPKCGHGKLNNEDVFILLIWDEEIGNHRQVILNKSLQQPNKGVVYLHKGMRMQKTYEEEQNAEEAN